MSWVIIRNADFMGFKRIQWDLYELIIRFDEVCLFRLGKGFSIESTSKLLQLYVFTARKS